MADMIKFKRGLLASLPATGKDANTLYFTTDKGSLYLGDTLIGKDYSVDIKALQDAIAALGGDAGSIANQIKAEIEKLDFTDTAVDGEYVAAVNEVDGKISVVRKALPDYSNTYDAKGAAATAESNAKSYADGLAANYDEKGAAAGVKTELQAVIDTKVDKVEGKSLISDTEIARLSTVTNYDDSQVKADIAKKADAETMTTELGKKVDKVEGYSLVSDTEIARLATLKNYDDTELAGRVTTAEGKITDLETEAAKHAVKTEVEAALALKADKSVVDAMYTNDQIDGFIADAKKYADDNDANTTYTIGYESKVEGEGGHPARIVLTPSEGEVQYVDATPFIKDGMISSVTINEANDLVITFNTDAGKDAIEIPLDEFIDVYTGSTGARVTVGVEGNVISADLVAGSISKDYLDTNVKTSLELADSALQADDITHLATEADLTLAEGRISTLEGKPAAGITADQITNWDKEVGAKALAETKTTTAEVKDQIEAYGYDTVSSVNGKISGVTGGSTETIANIVKAVNSIYNGTVATDAVVTDVKENLTAVAAEVDTINETLTWGSF